MATDAMDNLPKFTQLNNLAAASNGAKILFATDDFFAVAENLLLDTEPLFNPTTFTEFGKEMDGWETRRKRIPGHDFCIIQLGAPTQIEGILADTAHFSGNYVPRISIQAATSPKIDFPERIAQMGSACSAANLRKVQSTEKWIEIVKMTHLQAGYEDTRKTYINIDSKDVVTHLRLNYFPDGGLARLKVYGSVQVSPKPYLNTCIDLLSVLSGTVCYGFSNAHYGHPANLIKPLKSTSMADGWETARRLDRPPILQVDKRGNLLVTGSEYALFKLGMKGTILKIVIDTSYFKGNPPANISIEGVDAERTELISNWITIVSDEKVQPHSEIIIEGDKLKASGPFSHIKIVIQPDGGISRIRIYGNSVLD